MTVATYRVLIGDVREQLRQLPDASVQCVITSPPYYGLRSYLPAGHPDKPKELGLEETPQQYIEHLVAVFREVRRVLRDDGTLWLNLGDSFSRGERPKYAKDALRGMNAGSKHVAVTEAFGYGGGIMADRPEKNLLGIPWRVAFALQEDGWILRSDIIWAKPNPFPESVKDRPTRSHEYVFLMSKSPRYYYDAEAIKEDGITHLYDKRYGPGAPGRERTGEAWNQHGPYKPHSGFKSLDTTQGRNKRDVWTVATQPYSEAHFATFPEALVEPMILAGCPAMVCVQCGTPRHRITTTRYVKSPVHGSGSITGRRDGGDGMSRYHEMPRVDAVRETTGWTDCGCGAGWDAGTVLDPFAGSGTTLAVANRLGRHAIGIELNPEYLPLIERRCAQPGFVFEGESS